MTQVTFSHPTTIFLCGNRFAPIHPPAARSRVATPHRTAHRLPGALGEIPVDLLRGGREPGRPAVVLAHGFKGSKDAGFLPRVADRLARAGFTAVSFSTSGAGVDPEGAFVRPGQFRHNTYSADLADFRQVLDALGSGVLDGARPSSVGLFGFSRGGGMAILTAAANPRVAALVTWAAMARTRRWTEQEAADWRERGEVEVVSRWTGTPLALGTDLLADQEANAASLDILAAAARVRVPWLLVHGTADETVPIAEGRALAASAGEHLSTLWLEAADHHLDTAGAATHSPAFSRALDATVAHFARHLP